MYEELLAVLGVLGIGSLIATCLTYVFDKRKRIKLSEQKFKETRYKCIIVLMKAILKPEDIKYLRLIRPDIKQVEDLKNEVEMEWFNSLLFASDEFIRALKEFILKPDDMTYAKTVLAMRKDLWNKKTKLKAEECNI